MNKDEFCNNIGKNMVASYLKNNIKIHFSIYALELDWSFDYCKTDKSNVHGIGHKYS